MNKPLTISIGITLLLACGAFLIFQKSCRKTDAEQVKRVAILYPATHPAMTEIESGIKTTMKAAADNYSFDVYNANGNRTLLKSMADDIVAKGYDIVITIGTMCTRVLHESAIKRQSKVPIVFTAVEDPASIGIDQSKYPITGVMSVPDIKGQLEALLNLKPVIKTILVVYNPSENSFFEKRKKELENLARAQKIVVKSVAVYSTNEIAQKVPAHLKGVDVIWIFTDHTTVAGIDALVKLANQHAITLYASDLNSVDRGAALAYGVTEFSHGKAAAQKAHSILDGAYKPSDVPITDLNSENILKINQTAVSQQGLKLPEQSSAGNRT